MERFMEQDGNQTSQGGPAMQQQPAIGSQAVQDGVPQMRTKKSKKGLLVGIIIALLVLVGGGVATGVYVYMNNKPEKVLADALTNTMSDLLGKSPSSSVGSVTFESKGANGAKIMIKFASKSAAENAQGSADVTVAFAGKTYNIKASSVVIGDKELYFKVENLRKTVNSLTANQPEFTMYADALNPMIKKLDNQWIKVTQDDLKELGMVDDQKVDKCTAAVQNVSLSGDDKKQLKKLFKENQFVVASEKLKTEKAAGESSFHYKLDFNDKAAEGFAKQVIAMQSFATVKKDCDINEKDIESSLKSEESSKKDQVKPVVELWVGKKSRRPTKFSITASDKEFTLDFNTEMKLNDTDVVVEKPSKSTSIEELKAEFEKLYSSANSNTLNTSEFENL